jgi:transposase-like protein
MFVPIAYIFDFMLQRNRCPDCQRSELIRVEHIVTGTRLSRAYFCGYCGHEWLIEQALPANATTTQALKKPRTKILRGKRA